MLCKLQIQYKYTHVLTLPCHMQVRKQHVGMICIPLASCAWLDVKLQAVKDTAPDMLYAYIAPPAGHVCTHIHTHTLARWGQAWQMQCARR